MYLGRGMSGYIAPYGAEESNHTEVCDFPNYCKSEDTISYNDLSLVKDLSKTSFECNSNTKYGQLSLSKENSFVLSVKSIY